MLFDLDYSVLRQLNRDEAALEAGPGGKPEQPLISLGSLVYHRLIQLSGPASNIVNVRSGVSVYSH